MPTPYMPLLENRKRKMKQSHFPVNKLFTCPDSFSSSKPLCHAGENFRENFRGGGPGRGGIVSLPELITK